MDDPLFGYLAVTKDKGWMQGFVTCTTFTTWHRGFRWDSLNPCLDLSHGPGDEEENESSATQGSGGRCHYACLLDCTSSCACAFHASRVSRASDVARLACCCMGAERGDAHVVAARAAARNRHGGSTPTACSQLI